MIDTRYLQRSCLVLGCALIVGCSGDSRPLEEAVEASRLGLVTLDIVPPANTPDDHLTIATNQQVTLSLAGDTVSGNRVDIDPADRRWSVSTPGIVSIDDDGVVTGLAEGSVTIGVRLGGIEAPAYTVVVSDAALAGIDSIQGADTLARCVPESYAAIGLYDDGSRRVLPAAEWTLDGSSLAVLSNALGGTVDVMSPASTTLTLAVASGAATGSTSLTVSDTLRSLVISPTDPRVVIDGTLQLTASGYYAPEGTAADVVLELSQLTGIDITDTVEWRMLDGNAFASVTNGSVSRGLVSGIAEGEATVLAACDATQADRVVTVEAVSAISLELSSLTLAVGATEDLEVSTGTSFDDTNLVTESATWSSNNSSVATVSNDTGTKGRVTAGSTAGTATITVEYQNKTDTLTVTVTAQ